MTRRIALLTAFAAFLSLTGCGIKLVPVQGVVTLDGKPLEGATVIFTSPDGKTNGSGMTDATGAFSITTADKLGAAPGTYKVCVTKSPIIAGAVSPSQTEGGGMNKDYLKAMQKEMPKGGAGPMGGPKPAAGPKTEVPDIYASADKTTITVTVPSATYPIDLKSKP